ncbi:MAG: iron complex outerrane recepter protein, partial [Bacteroidetes bacterium]|nr:iron complex outerrane recepter protein [Bacteroidota bacterium]
MKHLWILLVIGIFGSHGAAAPDGAIRVAVTDAERHTPLAGAHVSVSGITRAGSTDAGGICELMDIPAGSITLRVAFVGYSTFSVSLEVHEGETISVAVALKPAVIPVQPITVTASRGRERETPATFSTLGRQAIRERYTTQDIPVLLSELPSTTYYSESGTGIGYTYLNIRGFDARRVAVMVNGVPQNDPEDHNVYWLDFPDLAASAEDIQVQRGAGSALYGAPAIGGSVNVETSHFARERSLRLSAGLGSYNTRKYSASFSSGLVEERYAMHARFSRLLSSGYRDRAWADFTSYFLGFTRYDESMTTQLHFYGGPVADGLAYYGIPKADVKDPQRRRANPIARSEEIENFSQPHAELL